mgnify:CR=1 FL=1
MAKLSAILDQIDAGSMLLPEFQRGYVWNRDQVRGLMRSLYLDYPVGALLVWETDAPLDAVRGASPTTGPKQLLLDGQQRVTTLYGIIRGRPPAFFDGDSEAFRDLRFNVETEAFQFHAPVKMKGDPRWIDVTSLFVDGAAAQYPALLEHPETKDRFAEYVDRLARLRNILTREFHIERITGANKTVDVVVDIFNRVNSGGTKLSKGDLALARICAEWGEARPTMRRNLDRWSRRGYQFTADWLLRNVNAVATGKAPFSALESLSAAQFHDALTASVQYIDHFLFDLLVPRLGVDHDRVLSGRYAVPVICRLLHGRGGRFASGHEADKALYWYVNAALRGRFAGSTETVLAKDLETVDKDGIDGVIVSLARSRKGNLAIDAQDFEGVGRGSRAYPLLYLLTRVRPARDLATGVPLGQGSGGIGVHDIFPKGQLTKFGYGRSDTNAIANFAFLATTTQASLVGRAPEEYLPDIDPDVLASQWIPADPALWRIDRYRDFLAARRELLAKAANDFLDRLLEGDLSWDRPITPVDVEPETREHDARTVQIATVVAELVRMGCAHPAMDVEVPDPETGRVLSVAEAFWPDGLQIGQGPPVVLELDPEEADLPRLEELGCKVFTSVDALRRYALHRSEVASGDQLADSSMSASETVPDEPIDAGDTAEAFETAVRETIDRCRSELRYNPRHFRVMVNQYGALETARRLLRAPSVSDGFVSLAERDRLDLAIEVLVVDERFAELFTDEERTIARRRLADFGFGPTGA